MNYKLESLGNGKYRIKIADDDITIKTIETTAKEIITTNFFSNSINELVELGVDKNEAAKLIGDAVQEVAERERLYEEKPSDGEEEESVSVDIVDPYKVLHPAIGVVDGMAYVGISLPAKKKSKKGKTYRSKQLCFITSNRELIKVTEEELEQRQWALAYSVVEVEQRWSSESVKRFLDGDEEVDPIEVYNLIRGTWKKYLEFTEEEIYDFMTIWTIGTYFFHLFNAYPYVYVGGVKASGKTKTLTIVSYMAFNSIPSMSVTSSVLFRLIQGTRGTFIIDESDILASAERAADIKSILYSGYKRGMKAYRSEKSRNEKIVPQGFEVYSPKILANIQGLEDVLEDRVIPIVMLRSINPAIANTSPNPEDPIWQQIRDKLYVLFLTRYKDVIKTKEEIERYVQTGSTEGASEVVKEIVETFKEENVYVVNGSGEVSEVSEVSELGKHTIKAFFMNGRDFELWLPILSIISFMYCLPNSQTTHTSLSTPLKSIIRWIARKMKERLTENVTETADVILIDSLRKMVSSENWSDDYVSVKTIKNVMEQSYDEEQKWLNSRWVGRALQRLGFADKRRVGTGIEYRITREKVLDLAKKYLQQ